MLAANDLDYMPEPSNGSPKWTRYMTDGRQVPTPTAASWSAEAPECLAYTRHNYEAAEDCFVSLTDGGQAEPVVRVSNPHQICAAMQCGSQLM